MKNQSKNLLPGVLEFIKEKHEKSPSCQIFQQKCSPTKKTKIDHFFTCIIDGNKVKNPMTRGF